jgi:diguanylate cyclase (GGDEF)-like protein
MENGQVSPAQRSSARPPAEARADHGRRLSSRRAGAIGALILVLGLATSGFLAVKWHASLQTDHRRAFQTATADLAAVLQSRLESNLELTRTMRLIATIEPGADERTFLESYRQVESGSDTLSDDVSASLIVPVKAAALPAFLHELTSDPGYRALLRGESEVVPAGKRSVYCLRRAQVGGGSGSSVYPALLDYCAPVIPVLGHSPFPALVRTATDSDSPVVTRVAAVGGRSIAAVALAVYRQGAPLSTVAERRAAVTGYIATTFDPVMLAASVLRHHRALSVAIYHTNQGDTPRLIEEYVPGAKRAAHASSYSVVAALGGGWFARFGGAISAASADAQELAVLVAGGLVTLLAFLLYVLLLRSRRRAWELVAEKTGELAHLALHDPLTGLPNRTLVLDRAQQLLARGRRVDSPVSALFLDIDGFKQINDVFGHQLGDTALRQIAERLQSVLRDSDTIGRIGGDEFVMLIDPVDVIGAERVANRVLRVLSRPIVLPPPARSPVSVTASIGIATGLPSSAEDLLRDADLAMYQAKAVGKGGYVMFDSSMQTEAQDRTELEMGLAEALDAGQFTVAYQPIVDLTTQRVAAVEALLRWRHPTRGDTSPGVFIPIAESSGLIVPIGRWVLGQACAQCAAWHRRGHSLAVSVNVSARQFERPEFVDEVRAALADNGLDAAWLTLEITETALMNHPAATEALLMELKALGVQIAVDDFGTGYSSLGYLRQFPIDALKLDRSFITGLARSGEANALAHTLIQLGKTLGLRTVAEGVEAYTQLCQLQVEGCDLAQGYLFARPLTPEALEIYLGRDPSPPRASAAVAPIVAG